MPEMVLPGCRTTPLSGYLTALGLLRTITRLLDQHACGSWREQTFVLHSDYSSVEDLVEALQEAFEPEAIVSPWNAGSGFAGNGKNTTAEAALAWVRASTDPRLATLRAAVAAGDKVVTRGRALGWSGSGAKLWDEAHKPDVLALCRTMFPDAALPWLDAAVALGQETGPAFSRLLGTGGNFGRQDLSATYLTRLRSVITDQRSRGWLRALLTGDESVPYLRDAVGQFDPGRAGGIQSSPWEKSDDKGFVNPWSFLLTVAGTLLFATAVVRRHGTEYRGNALPFQVRGSTSGHPTMAEHETVLGELWVPEWDAPAGIAEITHLFGEAKIEWRQRPAASGLDVMRAIATLGVDRGLTAFRRYLFVDRLGQNPLAVPADRVAVTARDSVRLLGGLDSWRERLQRAQPPAQVAARLRALENALFTHARTGSATDLVAVFSALGRCHAAVERSGAMRAAVPPLVLHDGPALLDALWPAVDDDCELRVAVALATARDQPAPGTEQAPTSGGLRPLLAPVIARNRRLQWSERPTTVSLHTGLGHALAEAARRRTFAAPETVTTLVPAVRGVRIAFTRGVRLASSDMDALVNGTIDDTRVADLLTGLLVVDWHRTGDRALPGSRFVNPVLDLLSLFATHEVLTIPTLDGPHRMLLRPAPQWPGQLLAGKPADVLADAVRRLRISSGCPVIDPTGRGVTERLAARLLIPPSNTDLRAAQRYCLDLPIPARYTKETTAS